MFVENREAVVSDVVLSAVVSSTGYAVGRHGSSELAWHLTLVPVGQDVLCVAMCSVWNLGHGRKIVHPVKRRLACDGIDAAHQEVDIVRLSRSQARCELAANEVRKT